MQSWTHAWTHLKSSRLNHCARIVFTARLIRAVALWFPQRINETITIGIILVTRIVRLAKIVSSGAAQLHDLGAAQRAGAVGVLQITHLTAPSGRVGVRGYVIG